MREIQKVALLLHTLIQCTLLLVEKAGVAPDMTLMVHHAQASKCAGESPVFETHGEGQTKSKTGAISGPKNGPLSNKIFKRKNLPQV